MFTEQFFDLLLDFGDEWIVKEVKTTLETSEVDIYVEYFGSAKIYDYAPARRRAASRHDAVSDVSQLSVATSEIGERTSEHDATAVGNQTRPAQLFV